MVGQYPGNFDYYRMDPTRGNWANSLERTQFQTDEFPIENYREDIRFGGNLKDFGDNLGGLFKHLNGLAGAFSNGNGANGSGGSGNGGGGDPLVLIGKISQALLSTSMA